MRGRNRAKPSKIAINNETGASLTGYGLVVGLISIVALAAVTSSGQNVRALFGEVAGSLSAVSGGAGGTEQAPANQPPTAAILSASSITENRGVGAAIGTLSATDPDQGQAVTFALGSSGGDEGAFQIINGNEVQATQDFDFESPADTGGSAGDNVYLIEVIATDDGSPAESTSATLSITITDDALDNPTSCSNPAGDNLPRGSLCLDGSYFTGFSPADGAPVFMTASAHQTSAAWSPGQQGNGSQILDEVDGQVNVATMKTFSGSLSSNFPAANYCDTLSAHGHADWYLPAGARGMDTSEIRLLWDMIQSAGRPVDGIGTVTTNYWSSTDWISQSAIVINFLNNPGTGFGNGKTGTRLVRCVRR